MDLFEAIQKRRSVRNYTGDPIPPGDLLKIVEAGRLAASGSNIQPWDFIIIEDLSDARYREINSPEV